MLKGIDIFLDALDVLKLQHPKAMANLKKITFMGKVTADMGGMKPPTYFRYRTNGMGVEVQVFEGKTRDFYWDYLRSRRSHAVVTFPSRVENSPTVVLEAFMNDICFLASDVGGTPELLHPDSRSTRLFARNKKSFAEKMAAMLENGCAPARPGVTFAEVNRRHLGIYTTCWILYLHNYRMA